MFGFVLNTEGLQRAIADGLDLRPLLHRLGSTMVSEVVGRFKSQRIGNKAMPARGTRSENYANVAGIIRYLQKGGGDIPNRYFERRPALIDTGRLAQSITYQVKDDTSVKVGTNVKYAAKQAKGISETLPGAGRGGDRAVRSGLARYLRRNKDKRKSLGWLFSKDTVDVAPQPRDFLEVTPDLEKRFYKIIDEWVSKQIGNRQA